MWSKSVNFCFAKNVSKIMVLFWKVRKVRLLVKDGGSPSGYGGVREMNLETLRTR